MRKNTRIDYTCKECEKEIEVEVTPITPAQTYGPPENCYPEEGGEIEPTECPHCNASIDVADCHEKAADNFIDYYEDNRE